MDSLSLFLGLSYNFGLDNWVEQLTYRDRNDKFFVICWFDLVYKGSRFTHLGHWAHVWFSNDSDS